MGCGWLAGHGDAAANARAAAAAAPANLLVVMLGVTLGLYGRDRVRLRRTYASPTLAYLGKAFAFVALAAASTFVLSPVAWPVACLHLFAGLCGLGLCVWSGNLPSKL